jgi:hypothetical protein
MKYLLTIALIITLTGCGSTRIVEGTIKSHSNTGCYGSASTEILLSDGRLDKVCGTWGEIGLKVKGYWTEGSFDSAHNGLSFKF